jgi:hypothetical protein
MLTEVLMTIWDVVEGGAILAWGGFGGGFRWVGKVGTAAASEGAEVGGGGALKLESIRC